MSNDTRWAKVPSACGGITFASLLRSNRPHGKEAFKAQLHEWEGEGGSLAPSPTATDTLVTAGST